MAIRRTRQDKIEAQLKHQELKYSFTAEPKTKAFSKEKLGHTQELTLNVFGFSERLLGLDLLRSLLVTLIISTILVVLYWQLT